MDVKGLFSFISRSAPGAEGSAGMSGNNRRLQQTQAQVDEVRHVCCLESRDFHFRHAQLRPVNHIV